MADAVGLTLPPISAAQYSGDLARLPVQVVAGAFAAGFFALACYAERRAVGVAATAGAGTFPPRRRSTPAPVVRPRGANVSLIPERYIVKLEDDSSSSSGVGHAAVVSLLASAKPESVYNMTGFRGFVGELSLESLEDLRHHPAVSSFLLFFCLPFFLLLLLSYVNFFCLFVLT